jgi:putative colanic acid biosynthesis glycosyltransferase
LKKLLQINVEANYGSIGRIASGIGDLAIENGWESHIASYGRKSVDCNSDLIRIGTNMEYYAHVLKTRFFDKHGYGSKNGTDELIKQIVILKPSVIHLHNIHGYYLNYPRFFNFLMMANIPVVWTLHDCWPLTGHCTHYEHVGCEKWKTECHSCPQQHTYPASILVDRSRKNHLEKKHSFLLPSKLKIITVSNWLKEQVQQSYLSHHKVQTIYNGLDTSIFKKKINLKLRAKYAIENSFLILGVASGWPKNKGLDDFIQLSKILDKTFQIVLIGLSKRQIARLPVSIIGIERTNSLDTLVEWYSLADVYVNTSYEESFGMTTIEAMACGTPVVVYNATACGESVSDNVGFSVEKKNIRDLKDSIEIIKKKKSITFEKDCRMHVVKNFDKKERYNDYLCLYENNII